MSLGKTGLQAYNLRYVWTYSARTGNMMGWGHFFHYWRRDWILSFKREAAR